MEIYLKIMVINVDKTDNFNGYKCDAVYRNLSDDQLFTLKEILEYQKGLEILTLGKPKLQERVLA